MRYLRFSLFAWCAFSANVAFAKLIELSYTEKAISWNQQLDSTAAAFELDFKEAAAAKKTTAAWLYLGPCKGSSHQIGEGASASVSIVMGAEPTNPYYRAILTMIGMMTRENLGREPPEDLCRFALDIGKTQE